MDYSISGSYNSFLMREMLQQADMELAIREAIAIAEGQSLEVLQESVFDKIKEVWNKFVAWLKRSWDKFIENMMGIFEVDLPYLTKYKDIIIKKPFELELTMYDYNIDRIIDAKIEPFDSTKMETVYNDKSVMVKSIIKDFPDNGSTDELDSWIKTYFYNSKADAVDIDKAKVNLATYYDYCVTWKDKMRPVLQKDIDAINSSTVKVNNFLAEVNRKLSSVSPSTASAMLDTSGRYSALYEVDIKNPNGSSATSSGSSNTSSAGPTVGNDKTAAAAAKANAYDKSKENLPGENEKNNITTKEEYNKAKESVDNYTSICTKIAGNKLTVAESAYKDYMQVLRAHVKYHVNSKEKAANTAPAKGREYAKQPPPGPGSGGGNAGGGGGNP